MKTQQVKEKSPPSMTTVWHQLPQQAQQLAVDLIANLVSDYYWSQKKGESHGSPKHRNQD